MGCLILHQRYRKRYERYLNLANDVASTFEHNQENDVSNTTEDTPPLAGSSGTPKTTTCKKNCGNLPTINEGCCEDSPVVDIEDVGKVLSPKRSIVEDIDAEYINL